MPFDVVKREHRPVAGRELSDSFIERYPVHYGHGIRVFGAFYYLSGRLAVLSSLFHAHAAFAEVHEHLVHGQPV